MSVVRPHSKIHRAGRIPLTVHFLNVVFDSPKSNEFESRSCLALEPFHHNQMGNVFENYHLKYKFDTRDARS
jgi:hypothetical protein